MGSFVTEKVTSARSGEEKTNLLVSDIRTAVNGFLSFSIGDTQVSVVRDGLKFQYNAPSTLGKINAGLTKDGWSLRNDFTYQ
jgi:hypothetical protein